jgi:catechol 2,3-dioxygenase-like lactoylglutathione lyase family enzyme
MTVSHFALAKMAVADLEAQERFYTKALGLVRNAYIEHGEGEAHLREAILGVPNAPAGAAQLSLVQYASKPAPPLGEVVTVFMSDDVQATVGLALEAGGRVVVPVQELAEHRVKLAFVADPEGHTIEFLQNL